MGSLTFTVVIHEGRGFGPELQALCCVVRFGGSSRSTQYSVGADQHVFGARLQWNTSRQQLRRFSSAGQNVCKVTVTRRDGTKLGWAVLPKPEIKKALPETSTARKHEVGEWLMLAGSKTGEAAPQLRVHQSLVETPTASSQTSQDSTSQPSQHLNQQPHEQAQPLRPLCSGQGGAAALPSAPDTAAMPADSTLPPISESSYQDDFENEASAHQDHQDPDLADKDSVEPRSGLLLPAPMPATTPAPLPRPHSQPPSQAHSQPPPNPSDRHNLRAPPRPPASSDPGSNDLNPRAELHSHVALTGQRADPSPPNSWSLAGPPPGRAAVSEADGPFREFGLTLDIRSFQAGSRLPLNLACTYVQALLPAGLLELVVSSGRRLPSKFAPLRTHPAVDIARGAEGALPNGAGTLEFVAGVVQLAGVLAQDPRVSLEVWHKEKFRADMLLGVASVPLAPLLHDCWVDGQAPVCALLVQPGPGSGASPAEERIQVGSLRVVLALEDKGPAELTPAPERPSSPRPWPLAPTALTPSRPHPSTPYNGAVPPAHQQQRQEQASRPQQQRQEQAGQAWHEERHLTQQQQLAVQHQHAAPGPPASLPRQQQPFNEQLSVLALPAQPPISTLQQLPEYEAAYQLEVWKKEEELKWRAGLRERESQRMAVLEAEWRKRERLREAEIAAMRREFVALEDRARQALATAEDRERRLLVAEEASVRRRKDMEREHAARMAEAEAAVRRLQVECEHQLEMERDRLAEAVRQRAVLEERLAMSETRGAALEQAFAGYRDAMRNTSEVALQRELLEVRDALRQAEERAARASKAKVAYKEQVVALAEQLASLYKARQAAEADPLGLGLGPGRSALEHRALRLAAHEHERQASGQHIELLALRQQLHALKASALETLSPDHPPTQAPRQQQKQQLPPDGPLPAFPTPQRPAALVAGPAELQGPGSDTQHPPDQARRLGSTRAGLGVGARQGGPHSSPSPRYPVMPAQAAEPQPTPTASRPTHPRGPSGSGVVGAAPASGAAQRHGGPGQSQADPLAEAQQQLARQAAALRQSVWHDANSAEQGGGNRQAAVGVSLEQAAMVPNDDDDMGVGREAMGKQSAILSRQASNPATLTHHQQPQQDHQSHPPPAGAGLPRQGGQQDVAEGVSHDAYHGHDPGEPPPVPTASAVPPPALAEIQRLLARKSELLASGVYARDDPLIQRIEQRVAKLAGLPPGRDL
ncbi:hypothetical protein V8C86DRAFT_2629461 [Haematococcus lacustris]